MRVASNHSVDEFMGKVGTMRAHLDAERVKKVRDNGTVEEDEE
jgi:hypothetical protein